MHIDLLLEYYFYRCAVFRGPESGYSQATAIRSPYKILGAETAKVSQELPRKNKEHL